LIIDRQLVRLDCSAALAGHGHQPKASAAAIGSAII